MVMTPLLEAVENLMGLKLLLNPARAIFGVIDEAMKYSAALAITIRKQIQSENMKDQTKNILK